MMNKEEFLSFYDVGEITTDQLSNFVTSVDIREGAIYLNRLHTGEEFLDQLKAIGVVYNTDIRVVGDVGVIEFSDGQSNPFNLGVNTINHNLIYNGLGLFTGMDTDGLTLNFEPLDVKKPLVLENEHQLTIESNVVSYEQYARMEYLVEGEFNEPNSNGDTDTPFTHIAVYKPFINMAHKGFTLTAGKYLIRAFTQTYLSKNVDAYLRIDGAEVTRSNYSHSNSGAGAVSSLILDAEIELSQTSKITFGINGSGGNSGNLQKFGVGYRLNESVNVKDNLFAYVDIWKVG